jgi:NADH:ubiquinone oxidoreductase subunit E
MLIALGSRWQPFKATQLYERKPASFFEPSSPDGKFTVWPVECQGACANAPMIDLDGVYHEDLTPEKVEKILGGVK